jgi:hypothetical protein
MKLLAFTLIPLMIASVVVSEDRCGPKTIIPPPEQVDGPYVLYKNDKVLVKYIVQDNTGKGVQADSVSVPEKKNITLHVATDLPGKTFTVVLKDQLQNENPETANVNKMLVISDIEGNFAAFRKLLQSNGVIDENFNWTFGNGHLVLTGDFCDRGYQVTEVYWLIYSLEEKAKAAGGYVHYVLGNHEIMNMSGDVRYLHGKYLETEGLLNERYEQLFNEQSELGRWLRTKNVVEKVGDLLFAHGGISPYVNSLDITLAGINDLARPYYADTTYKYPDKKLEVLYSDFGPFWYRGYYHGERASSAAIDSTLSKFGVKYISTGHTIMKDTVSVWYDNRVFNTDVHHAEGKSEALLVEDKKFYRVNATGNKTLLF